MNKGGTPQNLKSFTKGQSGNPNGRPKKIPDLDRLLGEIMGDEKDGISAAQAILMALRKKATSGDIRAAEVLLDRAYGKSKQSIDHTTNGKNININTLDADDIEQLIAIKKKANG